MPNLPADLQTLRYEVADRVAVITLDSPANNNGFTPRMCEELIAAARAADGDDEVRAVVLTGTGRFFCPGADLSGGESTFDIDARKAADAEAADDESAGDGAAADEVPVRAGESADGEMIDGIHRDRGGRVALTFAGMRKPVITAFNGSAVGVGATMSLPTDIRIASSEAKFGFVFARRGIAPEAASSWFLPRIVGISQALEWIYTGRVFSAQEALAGGLVSKVVPPEELRQTALDMAQEIVSSTSAVSLGVSRQMLWSMLTAASPWEAHRVDSRAIYELGRGADAAEGVTSFLEKRAPEFGLTVPSSYPEWMPRFPGEGALD
ncbi:enoyl-CoA hydratase-related protein [Brevibacterium album]|uniref:enoyl-CoA hydratase-related protein n=1 Tax=Brevibacterium album TaxID=417948 RepID=UPI0003FB01F0|nr:enoyl-CoA hydratase-related protein [Brevibacterium album]